MCPSISKYTDDVVKIFLSDYDINSLTLVLINNIQKLNSPIIRKFLPDSMWASFGGVDNFVNWVDQNIKPKS